MTDKSLGLEIFTKKTEFVLKVENNSLKERLKFCEAVVTAQSLIIDILKCELDKAINERNVLSFRISQFAIEPDENAKEETKKRERDEKVDPDSSPNKKKCT